MMRWKPPFFDLFFDRRRIADRLTAYPSRLEEGLHVLADRPIIVTDEDLDGDIWSSGVDGVGWQSLQCSLTEIR